MHAIHVPCPSSVHCTYTDVLLTAYKSKSWQVNSFCIEKSYFYWKNWYNLSWNDFTCSKSLSWQYPEIRHITQHVSRYYHLFWENPNQNWIELSEMTPHGKIFSLALRKNKILKQETRFNYMLRCILFAVAYRSIRQTFRQCLFFSLISRIHCKHITFLLVFTLKPTHRLL